MSAGEGRSWRIGPLSLHVQAVRGEWRITHSGTQDPLDDSLEVARVTGSGEEPAEGVVERYIRRSSEGSLILTPALADRPVVSRPATAFGVLPGEEVRLFVSTPVWVRVEVDPPRHVVRELPTLRPSDTWFGPSTLEGEACYATRTACRLSLDDMPFRPHRAITPILLKNLSRETLPVEKLSIPVPSLSLYHAADGHLWSGAITLTRSEEDGDRAELEILEGPPEGVEGAREVNHPRVERSARSLFRAFGSLF